MNRGVVTFAESEIDYIKSCIKDGDPILTKLFARIDNKSGSDSSENPDGALLNYEIQLSETELESLMDACGMQYPQFYEKLRDELDKFRS